MLMVEQLEIPERNSHGWCYNTHCMFRINLADAKIGYSGPFRYKYNAFADASYCNENRFAFRSPWKCHILVVQGRHNDDEIFCDYCASEKKR